MLYAVPGAFAPSPAGIMLFDLAPLLVLGVSAPVDKYTFDRHGHGYGILSLYDDSVQFTIIYVREHNSSCTFQRTLLYIPKKPQALCVRGFLVLAGKVGEPKRLPLEAT